MYKKDLNTASGMWGLWNYDTYKHIDDYDKWYVLFCEDEDIIKQVESHFFVPVYIFEDGCRSFTVRIDEDEEVYKLTGNTVSNLDNEILEITLNSPLGNALFNKKVEENFIYKVGEDEINGIILKIE